MGMFYRTIRMVENGIKPVYVFDGKPPDMKSGELSKRTERREEAQKALDKAVETGDQENVEKFGKRLVKVTSQHNDECKKLLTLMGIPYVNVINRRITKKSSQYYINTYFRPLAKLRLNVLLL